MGEVMMTLPASSVPGRARTRPASSSWCFTKRGTMSLLRSLMEGSVLAAALDFRGFSGSSALISARPSGRLKGERRSHRVGENVPYCSRSNRGKYDDWMTMRWSRHCATLHWVGSGFQLS